MNRIILASLGVLVLAATACGGDDGGALPDITLAAGTSDVTIPTDLTIPSDLSVPPGLSIPAGIDATEAIIDSLVSSMEQSGAKVDRDCVRDALDSVDLSKITTDPNSMDPAFVQKFIACITPP